MARDSAQEQAPDAAVSEMEAILATHYGDTYTGAHRTLMAQELAGMEPVMVDLFKDFVEETEDGRESVLNMTAYAVLEEWGEEKRFRQGEAEIAASILRNLSNPLDAGSGSCGRMTMVQLMCRRGYNEPAAFLTMNGYISRSLDFARYWMGTSRGHDRIVTR